MPRLPISKARRSVHGPSPLNGVSINREQTLYKISSFGTYQMLFTHLLSVPVMFREHRSTELKYKRNQWDLLAADRNNVGQRQVKEVVKEKGVSINREHFYKSRLGTYQMECLCTNTKTRTIGWIIRRFDQSIQLLFGKFLRLQASCHLPAKYTFQADFLENDEGVDSGGSDCRQHG